MKVLKMIAQIFIIYGVYLIGVYIQTTFNFVIPGSIIGMLLLFSLLMVHVIKADWLQDGASFLLAHLNLLFLPATAGVVGYLSFFKGKGVITIPIVIISTILVMVGSGFVGQYVAKKQHDRSIRKLSESQSGKVNL